MGPEEPMIAFRCPPSLRNLLVQAEVLPTNDSSIPPIQHGMFIIIIIIIHGLLKIQTCCHRQNCFKLYTDKIVNL